MNRFLLFALSLALIVVLSACSTKVEGSVSILEPAEAGPLSAPNSLAATTLELEIPDHNTATNLQFLLAPHGITLHSAPPKHPATSIVKLEVTDLKAVRELQYVFAPISCS